MKQRNKSFFNRITYLPFSTISSEVSLDPDKQYKTSYYKDNQGEFSQLETMYGEHIRMKCCAPVTIGPAKEEKGYGLFAFQFIKDADFLGEYSGIIRPVQTSKAAGLKDVTAYSFEFPVLDDNGMELEINAGENGNEMRFVNHSFSPNARIEHCLVDGRWVVFFVAAADIHVHDEITIDYGLEFWACSENTLII